MSKFRKEDHLHVAKRYMSNVINVT